MIYTNKRELLRAIWKNWQDCRPVEEEERDTICTSFIWEYMKNACKSEADRLCKMEIKELRGMLELPGGSIGKESGKKRTKKYSRLLCLEQLIKDGVISEEDFYHGLEKIKKGITTKLAKHPEDEKEILNDLEFTLLKRVVEDFFTNNGFKLLDHGGDYGFLSEENSKESRYEDPIWLYTEFSRSLRKSEFQVSKESNKARDEAYIQECEVFYQLLNQYSEKEMKRAIKQMFLPLCIDPDTGMGVYLIGKDIYDPSVVQSTLSEKERLCSVCFLEFSSEDFPKKKEERLISVDYSVIAFCKDGGENVRNAMKAFLDYLDYDDSGMRFLNYSEMNTCLQLQPIVPESLLPFFFEAEITTAEKERREEAKAIEKRKQRDMEKIKWKAKGKKLV